MLTSSTSTRPIDCCISHHLNELFRPAWRIRILRSAVWVSSRGPCLLGLQLIPPFLVTVLMILAIGASWVEDSRLSHSGFPAHTSGCRGFKFYSASLGRPTPSSVIIPSTLFDIQASVLGVIWLLGATTPVATWSASGFARESDLLYLAASVLRCSPLSPKGHRRWRSPRGPKPVEVVRARRSASQASFLAPLHP